LTCKEIACKTCPVNKPLIQVNSKFSWTMSCKINWTSNFLFGWRKWNFAWLLSSLYMWHIATWNMTCEMSCKTVFDCNLHGFFFNFCIDGKFTAHILHVHLLTSVVPIYTRSQMCWILNNTPYQENMTPKEGFPQQHPGFEVQIPYFSNEQFQECLFGSKYKFISFPSLFKGRLLEFSYRAYWRFLYIWRETLNGCENFARSSKAVLPSREYQGTWIEGYTVYWHYTNN
jgi:hypothetical protein